MNKSLCKVFSEGNISIPIYFIKNYKKFNLGLDEFLFLMYLYNLGDNVLFNPGEFSDKLNVDLTEIMNYVGSLTDKGLIRVEVIKNDKGYMEEMIILDDFYNKLSLVIMDDVNESKSDSSKSDVFEIIEKEFGRTLSPIEIEIIRTWLDNNFSEDLIKEALKEATFNGVSNLRYIDKILYEWAKSGINTVEAVEEKRKKARSMAMELMLDAYNHDKEIDDTIAESSAHAESLLAENQESRSMIKDIRKEKENTNEIYNVSEGSQEAEELEILRKGRDSMGNPQAVLTENEYARYKELYADGLSDYHSRMLQLDADEKVYTDKIRDNNISIAGDYAFNRNMGIERLKTHEMYDAKKQGEQIVDAASKEIISNVMQDAVDKIDEDMDNKKEEALEKKQEKQEMEEDDAY